MKGGQGLRGVVSRGTKRERPVPGSRGAPRSMNEVIMDKNPIPVNKMTLGPRGRGQPYPSVLRAQGAVKAPAATATCALCGKTVQVNKGGGLRTHLCRSKYGHGVRA